ncbi:MAG: PAS domain-containing protein, partial [Pirellulales bacterium]|nr:PAS domain-containing protein [Pirellulales bacterium]
MPLDETAEPETGRTAAFLSGGGIRLLIDPDTQRIVDWNAAAARFYGLALDETQGLKIADIVDQPE